MLPSRTRTTLTTVATLRRSLGDVDSTPSRWTPRSQSARVPRHRPTMPRHIVADSVEGRWTFVGDDADSATWKLPLHRGRPSRRRRRPPPPMGENHGSSRCHARGRRCRRSRRSHGPLPPKRCAGAAGGSPRDGDNRLRHCFRCLGSCYGRARPSSRTTRLPLSCWCKSNLNLLSQ